MIYYNSRVSTSFTVGEYMKGFVVCLEQWREKLYTTDASLLPYNKYGFYVSWSVVWVLIVST